MFMKNLKTTMTNVIIKIDIVSPTINSTTKLMNEIIRIEMKNESGNLIMIMEIYLQYEIMKIENKYENGLIIEKIELSQN